MSSSPVRAAFLPVLSLFFLFSITLNSAAAQQSTITDSLLKAYQKEKSLPKKAKIAGELSQIYMSMDTLAAEKWGNQAIEDAEISRDRKAMFQSQLDNGLRFAIVSGKAGFDKKALAFLDNAQRLAKENKLDKERSESLLWKAYVYLITSEIDQATSTTTEAFSLAQEVGNDSLLAACYYSFAKINQESGNKLEVLKNILEATAIAENINNHALLRNCYLQLSEFYRSVKNYDKALDYTFKVLELDKASSSDESKYGRTNVYNSIATIYLIKKNYAMAERFHQKAILYADTINFQPQKLQGYLGLLNLYLANNDPKKALAFFQTKNDMKKFISDFGMTSIIDQAYAHIYTRLQQYDSAGYYYNRCLPFFENNVNASSKLSFYYYYGEYLILNGQTNEAISIFEKAKQVADGTKSLDWMRVYAKMLDSTYSMTGNYAKALFYNRQFNLYKDSSDKLSKEDEILQLQIADEEKRQQKLASLEKERIEKRNRIQYMGIIVSVGVIFIALVLLGLFRVSARTIRIVGFFAFLIFFEFIFLVFKKSIFGITQGEPLKDLAMMILIAAILVPLHHWLEHKVIHYLSSQQMLKLRTNSRAWWQKFSNKQA